MSEEAIELGVALEHEAFRLDVSLTLPARGITGVFGPSGSGKTTLLRVVAGLEPRAKGRVVVGGEVWLDALRCLPPERRGVGYVFQEPRLFSHLDVRGNLDYAVRRRAGAGALVDEAGIVDLLGIGHLIGRAVRDLSGGEAQRVAIARALLRGPRLLLMDEPLASLDRARREEVMPFLDRLHAELSVPVIYVSHSIEEICRLCDHLVVLEAGEVAADGDIRSVLADARAPLLQGEEAGAVIATTVSDYDAADALTTLRFSGGDLLVPGRQGTPGSALRLRIRASDVSLTREPSPATSILNVVPATVESLLDAGAGMTLVRLRVAGDRLLARITRRSARELGLAPGDAVHAQIKSASIRNIPQAGSLDRSREL